MTVRNQSLDVSHFEDDLNAFKDRFSRNLKKWVMDIEDDKDIREEYEKR